MEENKKCYVCYDFIDNDFLICENKDCQKIICLDCLKYQMMSQLSYEENGEFLKHQKNIYCANCKQNYDNINNTFKQLLLNESFEFENKIYQKRIQESEHMNKLYKLCELEPLEQSDENLIINFHKSKIQDTILNLHCPHCNIVFFDFDGCYAIKCNNCANYICGWCLGGFTEESECHDHMLYCKYTLNYGEYSCGFDRFVIIQNFNKMKKINEYMEKINPKYKTKVLEAIKTDIKDLNIDKLTNKFKYYSYINYFFSLYAVSLIYKYIKGLILFYVMIILMNKSNTFLNFCIDKLFNYVFKDIIVDDEFLYINKL